MRSKVIRPLDSAITYAVLSLLLLGAASLSGCASSGARSSGSWQQGANRSPAFTRVLVVGVTPDVNQRCAFEFFLASQISSEAVKGIASCRVVKQKTPLTLDSIKEAVAAQQADAVVATALVDMAWGTQEGSGRDSRGGGMYKATDSGYETGYYGVYGIPVVYGEFQTAPSVITMEGEAHVVSRVFETRGATLIYTAQTVARNLESSDAGVAALTEAIADRLRRDGLIR